MSSFLAVELGTMGFQFGNCPRIRVYAGKVHFTLEILPNSPYHLQRPSLRLSAQSSES